MKLISDLNQNHRVSIAAIASILAGWLITRLGYCLAGLIGVSAHYESFAEPLILLTIVFTAYACLAFFVGIIITLFVGVERKTLFWVWPTLVFLTQLAILSSQIGFSESMRIGVGLLIANLTGFLGSYLSKLRLSRRVFAPSPNK